MVYQGKNAFKTHRLWLHLVRGTVIFIAIALWSQGIRVSPITTATIMSFTVPIFVLILAAVFLREHVPWPIWMATWGGFIGIVVVLQPDWGILNSTSLCFIIAAMLFGLLDIINKKYVNQEPILGMLFYATLVATAFVAFPTSYIWHHPTYHELLCLLALGGGSNLILYFLLRAFALVEVSWLAPFRYLELFIAMGVGYVLFEELPKGNSYVGAFIIIPCTLLIGYYQNRKTSIDHN